MRFYTGHSNSKGAQPAGSTDSHMAHKSVAHYFERFTLLRAIYRSVFSILLQVLLRGTAAEMVVDIACLDTTGTVIAHLPAVRPRPGRHLADCNVTITAKVAYRPGSSESPLCNFVPADYEDDHT